MGNKKTFVIDADTLLVRASCACQSDSILVTHIATGREKYFANKTEFWGKNPSKKDGGWLEEQNAERRNKGLKEFSPDDFSITISSDIINGDEVSFGRLKSSIESILDNDYVGDFRIVIGSHENFRYDVATVKKYKGNRIDKPLRFDATKEYALSKYKDKVIHVSGIEADDVVSIMGWYGYRTALKEGDKEASPIVTCACDKDLLQVPGFHLNYLTSDKIPQWVPREKAARRFWTQMLTGDATDNIPGVFYIPDNVRESWGIRKGKGNIGGKTAELILQNCESEEDYYTTVKGFYEECFGNDYSYISYDGRCIDGDWRSIMEEQFKLLRMMERKDILPSLELYEKEHICV